MATRSESFLSDQQARDTVTEAELAHRPEGQVPGAARQAHCRMGAFIGVPGAHIQTNNFSRCFPGMYAIPRIQVGRAMRVHQHGADRPLSRRRAAGGELRAGAPGRRGGARHRHRSGAAAPAQSHSAQVDPLQDRGRHDLRLRRLRADPRQGAGARPLRRVQEAPPRVLQAQEAARHRRLVLSRTCGRSADRKRVAAVSRRRASSCSASACRTPDRVTPRSIRA